MLTEEIVLEIIAMSSDPTIKKKDIYDKFKISKSSFLDIVLNRTWKHLPRSGYIKKLDYYKNLPQFTKKQFEIINGSLLGDGSIHLQSKNNSFRKSQSILNKEYLDWHYSEMLPFSKKLRIFEAPIPIHFEGKITGKSNKKTQHIEFSTINHSFFNDLRSKWYQNYFGKKIVPKDLILTPLTLAVWFCDDGTNNYKHGRAKFSTNGFNKECVEFLSSQLFDKYKIQNNIYFETTGYVIDIRRYSYIDFIDIIKPFIIFNCFKYKTDTNLYVPPKFFKNPYKHKNHKDKKCK